MKVVRAPTEVSRALVTGYRCDKCDDTHIVMQLTFPSPEDSDAEGIIMVFQMPEDVAANIAGGIVEELTSPAPGYHGSIDIPIVGKDD